MSLENLLRKKGHLELLIDLLKESNSKREFTCLSRDYNFYLNKIYMESYDVASFYLRQYMNVYLWKKENKYSRYVEPVRGLALARKAV